ncbi:MAG: hypothetical protein PHU69_10850 [Fermentimonas sp.]|nr:hypothetical protein [Fermentimonas sp.]
MLKDLKILLDENEKRFGKYLGYKSILVYLIDIFSSVGRSKTLSFSQSIIEKYLNRLKEVILQIKDNLERLQFNDIYVGILAKGYEFEKIFQYLYIDENYVEKEYFIGLVYHSDLPKEFINKKDLKLYRLIYDSYLYSKMNGKDYITYKELLHSPEVYISPGVLGPTGYRL